MNMLRQENSGEIGLLADENASSGSFLPSCRPAINIRYEEFSLYKPVGLR
jgi:hypothetical protein